MTDAGKEEGLRPIATAHLGVLGDKRVVAPTIGHEPWGKRSRVSVEAEASKTTIARRRGAEVGSPWKRQCFMAYPVSTLGGQGGDSEPKRGTGGVEHSSCQGLKKRSVT